MRAINHSSDGVRVNIIPALALEIEERPGITRRAKDVNDC